jgi:hypothetical protein
VVAVAWQNGDWLHGSILGLISRPSCVVEVEMSRLVLRHGKQTISEGSMTCSPYREVCPDYSLRLIDIFLIVPEFDAFV